MNSLFSPRGHCAVCEPHVSLPIAYHEAGHAVVYQRLGAEVLHVCGTSPEGHNPHVLACYTDPADRAAESGLIGYLAGSVAEERYVGGQTSDTKRHAGVTMLDDGGAFLARGSDTDQVARIMAEAVGSIQEAALLLERCTVAVRTLLDDRAVWARVQAVAAASVARGQLTGEELRAAMAPGHGDA